MAAVTQHRTSVFLTNDLAITFSVFDHQTSEVPAASWDRFTVSYAHGAGPARTLTEYVVDHSTWTWDTTYIDGAVVIGDPDGPLALETEADSLQGCRIVFWDEGNCYDTGLRVWEDEAAIIGRLLRERKEREG